MKIVVIAASRENVPERVAPLGAYIVADRLERSGHNVLFLDLAFYGSSEQPVKEAIDKQKPDLIAVSIRNINIQTFPMSALALPLIKSVVDNCKKFSDAKIIIGGSGFSIMPKQVFEALDVDYGLVGEAEEAIKYFAANFNNQKLFTTPGLVYRNNEGKIIFNKPALIDDINYAPAKRFNISGYPSINIQTKRGCVFRCNYCSYPVLEGRTIRKRGAASVVDEIEALSEQKKDFYFVDNVFNFPMEHATEICEEIIKRKLKIRWCCEIHPRYLDKSLALLMSKAGCKSVNIGVDSLSERIVQEIKKDFTLDEVDKCNKYLVDSGIEPRYFVMFGHLGDTKDTTAETFSNIKRLGLKKGRIMTGVRIYPGTDLASILIEKGLVQSIGLQPAYCFFGENQKEMLKYVRSFAEQYPTWTFPGLECKNLEMEKYLGLDDWNTADSSTRSETIIY